MKVNPLATVDRRRRRRLQARPRPARAPARRPRATRRSAAGRAPARSPTARTRAPAAGPGSTRWSAASTTDAGIQPGRRQPRRPRGTYRAGKRMLATSTMAVHDVAQRGFDPGAAAYDRARPSYPPDAVEWLVEHLRIGPGARAVDLAAGTGKLTRAARAERRRRSSRSSRSRGCATAPRDACPASRWSRRPPRRCRSPTRRSTRSPSRRPSTGSTPTRAFAELARVAAPGWPARARLERARSLGRLGRRAVVDHGPGREARTVA